MEDDATSKVEVNSNPSEMNSTDSSKNSTSADDLACENILSTINEACNKISMEIQNGPENDHGNVNDLEKINNLDAENESASIEEIDENSSQSKNLDELDDIKDKNESASIGEQDENSSQSKNLEEPDDIADENESASIGEQDENSSQSKDLEEPDDIKDKSESASIGEQDENSSQSKDLDEPDENASSDEHSNKIEDSSPSKDTQNYLDILKDSMSADEKNENSMEVDDNQEDMNETDKVVDNNQEDKNETDKVLDDNQEDKNETDKVVDDNQEDKSETNVEKEDDTLANKENSNESELNSKEIEDCSDKDNASDNGALSIQEMDSDNIQNSEDKDDCEDNSNDLKDEDDDKKINNMETEDIEDKSDANSNLKFTKLAKKESSTDNINEKVDSSKAVIKLRSFASLCDDDSPPPSEENSDVQGVSVGDIVEHNQYVESDECGVMHLKITNVVGGEDCITGISIDDTDDSVPKLQISSVSSMVENFNTEEQKLNDQQSSTTDTELKKIGYEEKVNINQLNLEASDEKESDSDGRVINIYKSPLVVAHQCVQCKKKVVCEFRLVVRKTPENPIYFICTVKCKNIFSTTLPPDHSITKPRLYFARVCGMCGKEVPNATKDSAVLNWQTREFCNKLCLADHIVEVARSCYFCKSNVRVVYMVKYCVRFGPDVHQFCCNSCLETYKSTIKVCSFCQKNLSLVSKVISPSNKEYCSNKCLKRAQRRDIGQPHYKDHLGCHVCMKVLINKFEFLHNNTSVYLCSLACMNVFKYVNKVKSVNCCLCARLMNAEEATNYFFIGKQLRVFCSESCFSVFVISSRKIVTCYYCKVKKYNSDMIWVNTGGSADYFSCSYCCLNLIEGNSKFGSLEDDEQPPTKLPNILMRNSNKGSFDDDTPNGLPETKPEAVSPPKTNQANSATPNAPVLKNCNYCNKFETTQFHMVMSDSTLKSFCSYNCASQYKNSFGFQVSGTGETNKKENMFSKKEKDKVESTKSTKSSAVKSKTVTSTASQVSEEEMTSIMNMLTLPFVYNKSTSCRPVVKQKSSQTNIQTETETQETQTDGRGNAIVPIPLPIHVPTPMMMYNAPTPVPLIVPVPIPIPIFIPTSLGTTKDIENKMKSIFEEFTKRQEELCRKRKRSGDEEETFSDEFFLVSDAENPAEVRVIGNIQKNLKKFYVLEESASSSIMPSCKRSRTEKSEDTRLDYQLGLAVWHAWTTRKKRDFPKSDTVAFLEEDFSKLSAKKLCHLLIELLDDLSSHSFKIDIDVLLYIFLGIQKYLFENGCTHCIFLEVNFDIFTHAFDVMIRRYFQLATSSATKQLTATRVTEEMLWDSRQLGAHTPHVLINTLFYFNTKVFKLKNALDHFNLTTGQISKVTKKDGDGVSIRTCLVYTKTRKGKTAAPPVEMEENKANPLQCPVKLYEFYISKCPAQIRKDKEAYYVYPERTCLPDSVVWFSLDSLEIRTIDKMLNRVLLIREVQESLFRP